MVKDNKMKVKNTTKIINKGEIMHDNLKNTCSWTFKGMSMTTLSSIIFHIISFTMLNKIHYFIDTLLIYVKLPTLYQWE